MKVIDDVFESIYTIIISNIQKSPGKCSGCIFDSVIDHNVNISKCNPLAGSSYTKLPKELDHSRKCYDDNINDSEYFRWCLISYLLPADHHPARITKAYKDFARKLNFEVIKFPVKIRDIYKIEKKHSVAISAFSYENKALGIDIVISKLN